MFGKIIRIEESYVFIENLYHQINSDILNFHVVFEEKGIKKIGEIVSVNKEEIKIFLVGEIVDNHLMSGVMKKPSMNAMCRIIHKDEVEFLIGSQNINEENLLIGKSAIYEEYNITTKLNDMFSNHFAILGNTGSGKSCGVAKIIQNIFFNENSKKPENAHLVLFDAYGEYDNALKKVNDIPGLGYRNFSTDIKGKNPIINIPAYFLDVDDLALLLGATSSNQIPILEKTLKLVNIFKGKSADALKFKDNIIASCILDILSSGKSSTQVRDQLIAVLSRYNTKNINLQSPIYEPGYTRTIRQCLNIDNQGKMNAVNNVVNYLEKYKDDDLSQIVVNYNSIYTLNDIKDALEFALISEGILKSDKIFDSYNELKVRLEQIINSDTNKFFETNNTRITKHEFINKMFFDDKKYQIININMNFIDDRLAKALTKIYSRMFFNYVTNLEERNSFPIHIVLEEAHRYVQNDTDVSLIGYNIFERIAKEGRKYGIILGLITQRPSELSTTTLSQCTNFISFRMFHPDDLEIIKSISSNVTIETLEKIKNLASGLSILFGASFKVPLICKLELPDPMPKSTNADIVSKWYN